MRSILQILIALGMEKNVGRNGSVIECLAGDNRLQDLLWQTSRVQELPVKMNINLDASISLGLEGGSPLPRLLYSGLTPNNFEAPSRNDLPG
jgi:hypothetical protein